jgi:hypothetical protein
MIDEFENLEPVITEVEQPAVNEVQTQLDKVRAEVSHTYDLFVRAAASRSGSILKKLTDLRKQEIELKEKLWTLSS